MTFTYARVGLELWGSQSIGECTQRQLDNIKSKRKVSQAVSVNPELKIPSAMLTFNFRKLFLCTGRARNTFGFVSSLSEKPDGATN